MRQPHPSKKRPYDVSLSIGEGAARGRHVRPLLSVLGDDLTELVGVLENRPVLGIRVDVALVNSGAEVLQASTDGQAVKLGRHGRGTEEDGEEGLGEHDDWERGDPWSVPEFEGRPRLQKSPNLYIRLANGVIAMPAIRDGAH